MKCHWCPNPASNYQDWDKDEGWVDVCLPCHLLRGCVDPSSHGSEAKRGAAEAREVGSEAEADE